MRAYVVVTGGLFVLIALAHVARLFSEGPGVLTQPIFLATSLLSVVIAVWAVVIFRKLGRPSQP